VRYLGVLSNPQRRSPVSFCHRAWVAPVSHALIAGRLVLRAFLWPSRKLMMPRSSLMLVIPAQAERGNCLSRGLLPGVESPQRVFRAWRRCITGR
jgi:hypothetical protein